MSRTGRKQKTPTQQRRRAHLGQRLGRALGRLLLCGVLLAVLAVVLSLFFHVETIEVEGAARYQPEEIVGGLSVKQGDNLYLWNKVKVSDALLERFPYVESVQIRRHLPDTLTVAVRECRAAVAVPTEGGYHYVSQQGKVLEQSVQNGGLPIVSGALLSGLRPGQMIEPGTDAHVDALLELLRRLDAAGLLDGLSALALGDLTDVHIGYQGRFDIRVGAMEELAYHLRFAKTVIEERLSPSDVGWLYWDEQDRLHFVPDTPENVAAWTMGQPLPQPTDPAAGDPADGDDDPDAIADEQMPDDGAADDDGDDA
ncbi:MAG: FtsQ-type POTRA domain-containing protein [Eubacteriales bacterium]|nr:FtsQ-type POTRA domain-containing protein [Eubacteriales bacterium]